MTLQINKQAIAQAFGRAAQCYEQHAQLQRLSGEGLLALAPTGFGPHVLDAGCGTGWYSRYWRDRGRTLTALDLSPAMLAAAREQQSAHHYVQGDIDHLPLADNSVDGVWSNLAVQWSGDLRMALRHYLRVTRPGGIVLFSTLLAGSLQEVHRAWSRLNDSVHANRFLDEAQFRAATANLPFDGQPHTITLHFASALDAMRSLKGVGATHLHRGRGAGLLTRGQLAQLERHWPRDEQGYRLSYHLMYGVLTQ